VGLPRFFGKYCLSGLSDFHAQVALRREAERRHALEAEAEETRRRAAEAEMQVRKMSSADSPSKDRTIINESLSTALSVRRRTYGINHVKRFFSCRGH
jgi:hypothetical protein